MEVRKRKDNVQEKETCITHTTSRPYHSHTVSSFCGAFFSILLPTGACRLVSGARAWRFDAEVRRPAVCLLEALLASVLEKQSTSSSLGSVSVAISRFSIVKIQ